MRKYSPRYKYYCKDCKYESKSVWRLSHCLNCKSENITIKRIKVGD